MSRAYEPNSTDCEYAQPSRHHVVLRSNPPRRWHRGGGLERRVNRHRVGTWTSSVYLRVFPHPRNVRGATSNIHFVVADSIGHIPGNRVAVPESSGGKRDPRCHPNCDNHDARGHKPVGSSRYGARRFVDSLLVGVHLDSPLVSGWPQERIALAPEKQS